MKWNLEEFLFVCDRRDSKPYHGGLKEAKPALSSLIITMVWRTLAGDYTVQTHQQIPPLLAKSAGCIQQSLLFLQHLAMPKFLQGDHTVSKLSEQCRRWFTVKHSKAGLQTSSHPQNFPLLGLQGPQQTPACADSIMLTSSGDVPSRSVQKTRWICLLSFSKVCKLSKMEDLVMWFLPWVAYTADLIVEERKTAPGSPL